MRARTDGGRGRRTFTPGEAPERPADPAVRRANLHRVVLLFKAYRWRLATVLGLIFTSALLGIVAPFLIRDIFDEALPRDDDRLLTLLVLGLIAIAVVTGILGVAQTWLSNLVGQRVMHDLRGRRLPASAAALPRVLHADAHGRGAVSNRERHRRRRAGRHVDRDGDRLQYHHRRGSRRRHVSPRLAPGLL